MTKYELHSRRLYRSIDPKYIKDELNSMEMEFIKRGYRPTRSPIGTIILNLNDRLIYYIPRMDWIEKVIFAKIEEAAI